MILVIVMLLDWALLYLIECLFLDMAELPSLGKYCFLSVCNQLDFLPILCQYCKQFFCKEHFVPDVHGCDKIQTNSNTSESKTVPQRYECSLPTCTKAELAPVHCPECNVMVCLSHRHQSDHNCSKMVKPTYSMVETKAKVNQILSSNVIVNPKPKKLRSVKAQKTAAKVQLMKLKMKSVGNKSLPQEERIYFLVTPPKRSGKQPLGVWVSDKWVMGKVVDCIAEALSIENENNTREDKKIKAISSIGWEKYLRGYECWIENSCEWGRAIQWRFSHFRASRK